MKKIEDAVIDGLYAMVDNLIAKRIRPDVRIDTVAELNSEMIAKLKQEYGIEGVILDVDETIRKNMKMIPEVNKKWIGELKKQLKIIVVSNGKDGRVESFLKEQGIDYIGFARKPLKKNFILACQKMQLEPSKVLVIGDKLFEDIYGGNKNKMRTALVKEVEDEGR